MTLAFERYRDPARYLRAVRPWLLAHEAEHALQWGILGQLVRRAARGETSDAREAPLLLRLARGDDTVGAALRTPPRQLILGRMHPDAAAELAARLAAEEIGAAPGEADEEGNRGAGGGAAEVSAGAALLPGVLGPTAAARAFAEGWLRAGGAGRTELATEQRLFEADAVQAVLGARGRMRAAGPGDRDLVAAWLDAFESEALPHEPRGDRSRAGARADAWLPPDDERGIYLWNTPEGPAAMAGYGGPTPSGIRIVAVYTPPDKRRRGFATALVSRLSLRLLERFERCFLFTDLANPTSNAIYTRLGYRPVTDVDSWRFDPNRSHG